MHNQAGWLLGGRRGLPAIHGGTQPTPPAPPQVDYLKLVGINVPAALLVLGAVFSVDDLTGFEITKLIELPEPYGIVLLWGLLLPTVYVLASSITNCVFKDALVLKVRHSGRCQTGGAVAQAVDQDGHSLLWSGWCRRPALAAAQRTPPTSATSSQVGVFAACSAVVSQTHRPCPCTPLLFPCAQWLAAATATLWPAQTARPPWCLMQ